MTINLNYLKTRVVRYPLLALTLISSLLVTGHAFGLKAADWASWVQAIGSIAAICGAFLLSSQQHKKDALAELSRQKHESRKADDNELAARTLAVRNLVQVARAGIESAGKLIAQIESGEPEWEREKFEAHIDQTRAVLDALISPNTDHLALLAALEVSRMLSQVRSDMRHIGGTKRQELLMRSTTAVADAHHSVSRLTDIQTKMLDLCRQRGILIQINDFQL